MAVTITRQEAKKVLILVPVFLAPSPPEPNPNLTHTTLHQSQVAPRFVAFFGFSHPLLFFRIDWSACPCSSSPSLRLSPSGPSPHFGRTALPPASTFTLLHDGSLRFRKHAACINTQGDPPSASDLRVSLQTSPTKTSTKLPHTSTPRRHPAHSPIAPDTHPSAVNYPLGHLGLGRRFAVKEMFAVKEQSRA